MIWTEEMDDILKKEYPKATNKWLSVKLGIPEKLIESRAKILNLQKSIGYKVGRKYFSDIDISQMEEMYKTKSTKDTALYFGISPSELVDFMNTRGIAKVISSVTSNTQKNINLPKCTERVRYGEFYYIPSTEKVGCWKAKEKFDSFDDRMFAEGKYFKKAADAIQCSKIIFIHSFDGLI